MGRYNVQKSQKSNNREVWDGMVYVTSEILTKLSPV